MIRAFCRISSHITLIAFLCLNGLSVSAQLGEEYFFKWDTDTNFDRIPFGNLVYYVFESTGHAKSHHVLTGAELAIIYSAIIANPKPERTYNLFEEACAWYQEIKLSAGELDLEYMGEIMVVSDQFYAEDKNAPYLAAYEALSLESKQFVLEKIESLRGTRLMGSVTTNYQKLFVDYPERAKEAYERLCDRLPEMLNELENWPIEKPNGNVHPISF